MSSFIISRTRSRSAWRVHAECAPVGRNHANFFAVFEDAHHVHGLDDLKGRFVHGIELDQIIAAIGNDAHLLVHGNMRSPLPARGNGFAGEVQGVSVEVGDDLDLVGVFEFFLGFKVGLRLPHD